MRHAILVVLHMLSRVILALTLAPVAGLAGQDPPRPQATGREPGKSQTAAGEVTPSELEKAVREHVAEKAKQSGGRFVLRDAGRTSATWNLRLMRFRDDEARQLDARTYSACAVFQTEDGRIVDVDFDLKGESGKLAVANASVHKVDGQSRFTYARKGPFWKRVRVGG